MTGFLPPPEAVENLPLSNETAPVSKKATPGAGSGFHYLDYYTFSPGAGSTFRINCSLRDICESLREIIPAGTS